MCVLPHSGHRLKPSVIPCRREDPPRCVQPAYCNSPCLCYTRPAFSFLPFFCPFVLPPCVEGLVFSHPGSPVPRIRPQLAHTPSTGLVWGFAGVVPLPGCQNRTRRHTGASLVFTAFSWYASFAEVPQAGTPGDNSPPREWEGSCKAASRFLRFRPKSTRWWAGFR